MADNLKGHNGDVDSGDVDNDDPVLVDPVLVDPVLVDIDGAVAWVTLNRPDRLNSFDEALATGLQDTWRQLRHDDRVRAIVLTASGDRAFCTGIDRNWVVPQPPGTS